MHERPLRRAASQHFEVVANGGKGPKATFHFYKGLLLTISTFTPLLLVYL
jgi:hypothetical protein